MPKLLIVAMLVLCSPALAQETASFRGNAEHTGVYSAPGAATVHKIKWQFHTGGKIFSPPAVAGNTVYFGGNDHFLRAVDLETGAEKWKFETGSRIPSSPAVANRLVYFLSYDSNFYALDATTGVLKWRFHTEGERRFAAKHIPSMQTNRNACQLGAMR